LASTRRRHLHVVGNAAAAPVSGRLVLPGGDFDVATPDLASYEHGDRS
jgi:hypothetical protein